MKNLDPEDLFRVFQLSDEEIIDDEQAQLDFRYHPYIITGMVMKGVDNFHIISEVYRQREGEAFDRIESNVKYKYYATLYKYLKRFNYQSLEHIEEALKHDPDALLYSLIELRVLFEQYEEYEKCARIRDVYEAIDLGRELLFQK